MKLFVGPMSRNVVDAVIELEQEDPTSDLAGFIPSRRQVESAALGGGYVCGWSIEEFVGYVASKGSNLVIKRDHGGPGQGALDDDGIVSLLSDLAAGVRYIHIDPWKKHQDVDAAARVTSALLDTCHAIEPTCLFEIGTEEGIRRYEPDELDTFLSLVEKHATPEAFSRVVYAVVQSGTNVVGMSNVGDFDPQRSMAMVAACRAHGLRAKEHNSDYLDVQELHSRVRCGVDAFNIAPEFGTMETQVLISMLDHGGFYPELNAFLVRCLRSGKWERWAHMDEGFQEECAKYLSTLCGHYNFETDEYRDARSRLITEGFDFDRHVREVVKKRIREIIKA